MFLDGTFFQYPFNFDALKLKGVRSKSLSNTNGSLSQRQGCSLAGQNQNETTSLVRSKCFKDVTWCRVFDPRWALGDHRYIQGIRTDSYPPEGAVACVYPHVAFIYIATRGELTQYANVLRCLCKCMNMFCLCHNGSSRVVNCIRKTATNTLRACASQSKHQRLQYVPVRSPSKQRRRRRT